MDALRKLRDKSIDRLKINYPGQLMSELLLKKVGFYLEDRERPGFFVFHIVYITNVDK